MSWSLSQLRTHVSGRRTEDTKQKAHETTGRKGRGLEPGASYHCGGANPGPLHSGLQVPSRNSNEVLSSSGGLFYQHGGARLSAESFWVEAFDGAAFNLIVMNLSAFTS